MKLYLVRHGRTEWNNSNRAQGHANIGLDETGREQARVLCEHLCTLDIERVLCSDLLRCQETVQCFLDKTQLTPEFREDLRERTFGSMEGQNYYELHDWMRQEGQRNNLRDWEVRPEGGESMLDVWNRLDRVESELRDETRPTLVVSHGGALAQLLAKLVNGTYETPRAFRFDNCGVTRLNRRLDGSIFLEAFNDCSHLSTCREVSPVR